MLGAEIVVGAHVGALEQNPEGLDAVRVDAAAYILAAAMLDGAMPVAEHIVVGRGLVRVHFGTLPYMALNEPVQRGLVGALHNRRGGVSGVPIHRAHDWNLAAKVRLIDLDQAGHGGFGVPSLADAVAREPSGFLRHADNPVQLQAGYALGGWWHTERR